MLLDLKFSQRRTIHYCLLVIAFFLQLSALIVWYYEEGKEEEVSRSLDSISSLSTIARYTEKINTSFLGCQQNLYTYLNSGGQLSLDNYKSSLIEISHLIDSLHIACKRNKEFAEFLKLRNESESNILKLQTSIDSIIENQINFTDKNPLKIFRLNKFEYSKVLDSIKTDSFVKVDSVARKGFFSRIGDAVTGKIDVQKEYLNITVTMLFNNKIVSGSIEEQIENVFKSTNSYYIDQFKVLKKSYLGLKEQDLKLKQFNSILLNLQSAVIPVYDNYLNTLQDKYKLKLENDILSHRKVRNYYILILMLLMIIVSAVLFSFTKLAFNYEKRLTVAKEKVMQSLNFKNRIIGMISHEIKSPLNILTIYCRMVSSSVKDPEIQGTFKSIEFTTNSLILLSSQILEYSKDENYTSKLKNKIFELKSELINVINSITSLIESKGNRIEFNSTLYADIEVYADAAKIHQLFYNIIGNANKFTSRGLINVDIKHELTPDAKLNLKVEISDNGIGISKQDLNNIFDLYYQGENSGKTNLGVGLGLNLCKEIVHLFKGQINVESQEGQGIRISFNIILDITQ